MLLIKFLLCPTIFKVQRTVIFVAKIRQYYLHIRIKNKKTLVEASLNKRLCFL